MSLKVRRLQVYILSLACSVGFLAAQGTQTASSGRLYATSNVGYPVYIGDTTVHVLVGDVIIYHNGAVLTCDSAARYGGTEKFDFFGRVVINQNTTYVYGDQAEYVGEENTARVFAPIIKVVDQDATMYTYGFEFNTLDNIGRYFGGCTMKQGDNYMESVRGYYFADRREMVGVDRVQMRNPDYQLQSDSVAYNMDAEVASFLTKTYIWNAKGEILSADRGMYSNNTSEYKISSDAYILTKEHEVWADSMNYDSAGDDVRMYGNIQMRDDKSGVIAFGDYARYWGGPQNALLTRNPSIVNVSKNKQDTLYMRSDSMFFYTFDGNLLLSPALAPPVQEIADGEELITPGREEGRGALEDAQRPVSEPDSVAVADAKLARDSSLLAGIDLTRADVKAAKKQARAEKKRIKAEEKRKAREAKAEVRRQKQAERDARILARRRAKMGDAAMAGDSTAVVADSITVVADSLAVADILPLSPDDDVTQKDSVQRVFRAYNNVKIYRGDMQAVCDSLVAFSADSTAHMYIKPVLWQAENQMTAELINIFTKDKHMDRILFTGDPMMVSEVEPGDKYNQVKGRVMESLFDAEGIYRHEVNANARTVYYMQDDKTGDYMGLLIAESSQIAFMFDSSRITRISYYNDVDGEIDPMDKLPPENARILPGFKWQADLRPELDDIFDRSIRESVRETYETMPQPQFPLTGNILRDRDNRIRRGAMVERNDRLTPATISWIRGMDPDYGRDPEDEVSRGGSNVIELPQGATDGTDSLQAAPIQLPDSLKVPVPDVPDGSLSAEGQGGDENVSEPTVEERKEVEDEIKTIIDKETEPDIDVLKAEPPLEEHIPADTIVAVPAPVSGTELIMEE